MLDSHVIGLRPGRGATSWPLTPRATSNTFQYPNLIPIIENIDNNMFRAQYGNHTKEGVKHDNPWEKMSSIYDRLFMFLHLLITIIYFFVVYILYRE